MAPANHRNALVAQHLILLLSLIILRRQNRRRRFYQHEITANRRAQGDFYQLLNELRNSADGGEKFAKVMRMTVNQFDWLLGRIGHRLIHKITHIAPISAAERLAITIRYLASGNEQASVALAFRVGNATVCQIVKETCDVIWEELKDEFVKFPSSAEEWLEIARGFTDRWQFPHCLGAIDGKHVQIQAPPNAGSTYYNYKKNHSIILMATCDADHCFTFVDIGSPGRNSDGGVFGNSALGKSLQNDPDCLNLPQDGPLPGTGNDPDMQDMPYCFVGDEAFPLKKHLMRPFPGSSLTEEKRVYNYRLSRARRIIENTFGILVGRWRIFKDSTIASPQRIESYVKAAVVLHNFLIKAEKLNPPEERQYCPPSFIDRQREENGHWRRIVRLEGGSMLGGLSQSGSNNYSKSDSSIRDLFMRYFNSFGAVPWQWAKVNRGRD